MAGIIDYDEIAKRWNKSKSDLKPLTETLKTKIKREIRNSDYIGYLDHYFVDNEEIWVDPEFPDMGWLWDGDTVNELKIPIEHTLKDLSVRKINWHKPGKYYVLELPDGYALIRKKKRLKWGEELYATTFVLNELVVDEVF